MGTFTVVPLVSQRIISVRLEGGLTSDDVQRLRTAQRSAIEMMQWQVGSYDLMVDIADSRIQDAAVASEMDSLRFDPAIEPRRMAFVCGSSPARMQVRRLAGPRGDGVFETGAEAMGWLKEV